MRKHGLASADHFHYGRPGPGDPRNRRLGARTTTSRSLAVPAAATPVASSKPTLPVGPHTRPREENNSSSVSRTRKDSTRRARGMWCQTRSARPRLPPVRGARRPLEPANFADRRRRRGLRRRSSGVAPARRARGVPVDKRRGSRGPREPPRNPRPTCRPTQCHDAGACSSFILMAGILPGCRALSHSPGRLPFWFSAAQGRRRRGRPRRQPSGGGPDELPDRSPPPTALYLQKEGDRRGSNPRPSLEPQSADTCFQELPYVAE